ncbi:MAG: hypothetical protein HFJ30_04380 [Clostridia bacterium]|nr:hypothetical protein [Clostridia bacterium]
MNIGFKGLDKIINIEEPQLILLTGSYFIEELSGDIANNICLKQECKVLEIVSCRKEYIIQRMFVNEANVNYRKWYCKNQYTDEEVKRIGESTLNLIESLKRLPTIIEQNMNLYDLQEVAKYVSDYANEYADREEVNTLVVLDIFPLSYGEKETKGRDTKRYRRESLKLIKKLKRISHNLRCPIIFIDNIDLTKKYNVETHSCNYLTKKDIDEIEKINRHVDTFIIANVDETINVEDTDIFNIDVYDQNKKIGTCKLKYDFICRKFVDYEGEESNGYL